MASRPNPAARTATTFTAYRIADARHAIFDGTGAALVGGRWNSPGRAVIYASASYACAMLELLAHAGTGRIPKNQKVISVRIPARVSMEARTAARLPTGWDRDDCLASRAFGDEWYRSRRSAVLTVPSVVAKYERNVVINPAHPDFRWISTTPPETVVWDARLFRR